MLLGPVFLYETRAIARRKRTFAIRGVYGSLLLIGFSLPLSQQRRFSVASELSHPELARLSQVFLTAIMGVQALAVLILTPALVGGTLAEDRARGRLEVVLASPLTSFEIIGGKLAARLVHLAALVATATPILGLLSLNGGVDLGLVVLCDGVMLTTGLLVAAVALAISTFSARPGRSILATYLVVAGGLALPFGIEWAGKTGAGLVGRWGGWARLLESALGWTNPLYIFMHRGGDLGGTARDLTVVMVVQVGLSLLLVLGLGAVLRPLGRGAGPFGWRPAVVPWLSSRRHWLPRPACGDAPMIWKECRVARTTTLSRLAIVIASLAIVVPLSELTWGLAASAFQELRVYGYGTPGVTLARRELNEFLRFTLLALYLFQVLGVAARSATSVTQEKEQGTWASLMATPMDSAEVIGGKIWGAIRGLRGLAVITGAYLVLGLAAGSIHPIAGLVWALIVVVYLGFTAVMGLSVSLQFDRSATALAITMGGLLALNMMPVICGFPVGTLDLALVLGSPLWVGSIAASYEDMDWFLRGETWLGKSAHFVGLLTCNVVLHLAVIRVMLGICGSCWKGQPGRTRGDRAVAHHWGGDDGPGPADEDPDPSRGSGELTSSG